MQTTLGPVLLPKFYFPGLFNTNDMPHWRKIKKFYLLGLSSDSLRSFISVFHQRSIRVKEAFHQYSALDQSVYTGKIFAKFAMASVVKCVLNFDIDTKDESENVAFIDAVHALLEVFKIN